jgi:hypothetical protein
MDFMRDSSSTIKDMGKEGESGMMGRSIRENSHMIE